eukprot:6194686-Pyramimonas_sp.AAC.1
MLQRWPNRYPRGPQERPRGPYRAPGWPPRASVRPRSPKGGLGRSPRRENKREQRVPPNVHQ